MLLLPSWKKMKPSSTICTFRSLTKDCVPDASKLESLPDSPNCLFCRAPQQSRVTCAQRQLAVRRDQVHTLFRNQTGEASSPTTTTARCMSLC